MVYIPIHEMLDFYGINEGKCLPFVPMGSYMEEWRFQLSRPEWSQVVQQTDKTVLFVRCLRSQDKHESLTDGVCFVYFSIYLGL